MREMVYLRLSINAGQVSKDEKRTKNEIHHLSPSYDTPKDTDSCERIAFCSVIYRAGLGFLRL